MTAYGESQYWDERYKSKKDTTFDWLESWTDVKSTIEKYAVDGLYEQDKKNPIIKVNCMNKLEDG